VTVPPEYFQRLYRQHEDPWNFATSGYERDKYAATLAALPRERYRNALELACSIGVFTQMLAARCDAVLAVDVSVDALARAEQRCRALANVRFAPYDLSREFPPGSYDLVTLCEVGFYFSLRDLACIREAVVDALAPGGDLVLVHWTPPVDGHALSAGDVHAAFVDDPRFHPRAGAQAPTYRLDVLTRRFDDVLRRPAPPRRADGPPAGDGPGQTPAV
jgi:SAM-dependent methyltransferase